jgi:hypothetical protein
MEFRLTASMRLRFQIPAAILPLAVESARLTLKLHAPGREVVVGAIAGNDVVPLRRLANPLGTESVEINEPRLLQPDEYGMLYLNVEIGDMQGGNTEQTLWRLESAGLEVRGRTPEEGKGDR